MAKEKTCAACKFHRKGCKKDCGLAAYFPSKDPRRFAVVQRVFRTSNILKTLQDIPTEQRADAVNNMVYEAIALVKDPIHGSSTLLHQLHKKIAELESELGAMRPEVDITRQNYENVVSVLITGSPDCEQPGFLAMGNTCQYQKDFKSNEVGQLWRPLWRM